MTFCFVPSLHYIASLGCWGLRNHRQSRRWGWRNRAPKQSRTSGADMRWNWYWSWVASWTWWLNDCIYTTAGREHFAFVSSNFNTTLKHRERSFTSLGVKQNAAWAKQGILNPDAWSWHSFFKNLMVHGCDEAAPVHPSYCEAVRWPLECQQSPKKEGLKAFAKCCEKAVQCAGAPHPRASPWTLPGEGWRKSPSLCRIAARPLHLGYGHTRGVVCEHFRWVHLGQMSAAGRMTHGEK